VVDWKSDLGFVLMSRQHDRSIREVEKVQEAKRGSSGKAVLIKDQPTSRRSYEPPLIEKQHQLAEATGKNKIAGGDGN